jgi:ribosomal protein S18 acetylase RimI-like enzyme
MNMNYRVAQLADVPAILPLMQAYYLHDRLPFDAPHIRGGLETLLQNPALGRVWIFESAGRAVGYLALTFGFTLEAAGREAYVDEFFVDEAFRGSGIGERVLKQVIAECPALEVKLLRLEVTRHNDRAMNLYKRLGFEDWGRFLLALQIRGA